MQVKFGTDGWRGIIGDDFTVASVRQVTVALAEHIKDNDIPGSIVIGYDRRFASDRFARAAAEVMAGEGIQVLFASRYCPTPAISFEVKQRVAAAGIVITASHNPAAYNGFKIKETFGGSARMAMTNDIEERVHKVMVEGVQPLAPIFDDCVRDGRIEMFDPLEAYMTRMEELVDLRLIARSSLSVVVDPMHGAGSGVLSRILRDAGVKSVTEIRGEANPGFGGVSPEPIRPNLGSLIAHLKKEGGKVGLALDGDADRIGVVDERGRFFDTHRIFACILRHLIENRRMSGSVAKTVSSSVMIERLAQRYERTLIETPIGFKWIAEKMLKGGILMGGEESGGLGYSFHLPERDGILSALLLLEACATDELAPARLLQTIFAEVGVWYYDRVDVQLPPARKEVLEQIVDDSLPGSLAGHPIIGRNDRDGMKILCDGGSWLLLRPSGTEPVLRIYAESETEEGVAELLRAGRALAGV